MKIVKSLYLHLIEKNQAKLSNKIANCIFICAKFRLAEGCFFCFRQAMSYEQKKEPFTKELFAGNEREKN
jgi:L-lysine 2,3-aminomutase